MDSITIRIRKGDWSPISKKLLRLDSILARRTVKTITFAKPHRFNGKEYTALNLDFGRLTPRNLIRAAKEARTLGDALPVGQQSKAFQAAAAALAAKVPVDLILSLPAKEFTWATLEVECFLLKRFKQKVSGEHKLGPG